MILEWPPRLLTCPNCIRSEVVRTAPNEQRWHHCVGLKGLAAPLVDRPDCKVEAIERADYVGSEKVQTDGEGRPITAIVTTYGDGRNDTAVLAPTATKVED